MTGRLALAGFRILVPRGGDLGDRLAAAVARQGGEPVIAPIIEFGKPADTRALSEACERLNAGDFDWLAVTSATTVEALQSNGVAIPARTRVAVVGPATGDAMAAAGFPVHFMPATAYSAAGMLAEWPESAEAVSAEAVSVGAETTSAETTSAGAAGAESAGAETTGTESAGAETTGAESAGAESGGSVSAGAGATSAVLLPQSAIAEPTLANGLAARGFTVTTVAAYEPRTVHWSDSIRRQVAEGEFGAVLLTSASIARAVADQGGLPSTTFVACIGDSTAAGARAAGLPVHRIADSSTAEGLVAALVAQLSSPQTLAASSRMSAVSPGKNARAPRTHAPSQRTEIRP